MSAHTLRRLQLVLTLGWLALGVPSLLWWRTSVIWLVAMSWWANVAGHWAAWAGARAEEAGTDA